VRQVFGDFVLDAGTTMDNLCAFYGLPVPGEPSQTLGQWLTEELHRPPVVGDSVPLGQAELSVRAMEGGQIRRVGIRLG